MLNSFEILIILVPAMIGLFLMVTARRRSTREIFEDLKAGAITKDEVKKLDAYFAGKKGKGAVSIGPYTLGDELAGAGYITFDERKAFLYRAKLYPLIFSSVGMGLFAVFLNTSFLKYPFGLALGAGIGYMYVKYSFEKKAKRYKRKIETDLPLVMERIVMAVQAGLDVIPAIEVILNIEQDDTAEEELEPVNDLFQIVLKLTDAGTSFDKALRYIASSVDCSALRHAFIHLGMAYRDGGQIAMPLRELSDSTQLHFQETVEEEIAKMPAKALLPIMCTFVGLLALFFAGPIVQIMEISEKTAPFQQQGFGMKDIKR